MSTVRRSRAPRLAAIVGAFTGALIASSLAIAGFSSAPTATHSVATDRIFPGDRSTTAWTVDDAADGSSAVADSTTAYADAAISTSGNFSSSWSTSRYVEFRMSAPMGGGLPVTGAQLAITWADGNAAGGDTLCWYFDVRSTSGGTVLATHGSSGSPVACESAGALTTTTVSLPEITSSDQVNDTTVRVYGQHSANRGMKIDRVNVTGAGYTTFTTYPKSWVDSSTGSATAFPWGPATTADSTYLTSSFFGNAYASTKYVSFTFPSFIPTQATVTGASLVNHYRSSVAGSNLCYYFEVYSGGVLIGSHGSTGSDVSCNSSATVNQQDTVSLTEITSPSLANGVTVKVYGKSSGGKAALWDLFELHVTYLLGSGTGCASSYAADLAASEDSWVDQNAPTTNFGTDTLLDVQSGPTNRRALVKFAYPAVPSGCSVTARLRLWSNSIQGTRTLNLYEASGSWTEAGVTWNNQPSTTGSPVSFGASPASTFKTMDVSTIAANHVSGTNNGFLLKDSAENNGANQKNDFHSRENTNVPLLRFAYGNGSVPYASDVQIANGGATAGKPESGDTITFTYSKQITASTVLAGWNGSSTSVTVQIPNNGGTDGPVTIWNSGGTAQLPLGSVALNGSDVVSASTVFAATMTQSGSTITVTLGSLTSGTVKTETGATTLVWTPATTPVDSSLNNVLPWDAVESGSSDVDF